MTTSSLEKIMYLSLEIIRIRETIKKRRCKLEIDWGDKSKYYSIYKPLILDKCDEFQGILQSII